MTYKRTDILNELGAQTIGRELWDSISDSQPPKQLVQRRIILPLMEDSLSKKHGVIPPQAITFFGPPGTGKTHFAKAIAGVLSWWYIEIVPSMLIADGVGKAGANLRDVMEKVRHLDEVVLFILVCATNYFRQLDKAMLRPGRFDCIIPVGGLDREGRTTIIEHYMSTLNTGHIELAMILN